MSYSASRRSFAPVSLVALSLALAGGGCSGESATNGGSAPDNTGGSFGGTGGVVTSTGGAPAGVGGATGGSESMASGGETNTGGTGGTEEETDPNAPIQADPGDEGDGVFEDPGPYPLSPEASGPIDDAPKGHLSSTQTFTSPAVYAGWTFDYQIFVPAQYEAGKPAALAVFQDGVGAYGGIGVMQMFENLIHSGEMPVTIVLFVSPGSGGRSENYDVVSDRYGRFLLEEMIPDVLADYDLVDDPNGWAIAGFSSGGSAAFTVAWFFPDNFRKVSTNSGSFVSIRTAHEFPQMIRDTEPKPLRVTLRSGTADLDNQFGSWLDANFAMAAALEEKGYHYRFTHGTGGHDMKHAAKDMVEEWRWLWRGFSLPYYE
jgi:enterochelin esterase-like enzyme